MFKGICHFCGKFAWVSAVRKLGLLKCRTCRANQRYRDSSKHQVCQFCQTLKHVCYRFNDEPVCNNCYRNRFMKLGSCQNCGVETKVSLYRKFGKKVCNTCRAKLRLQDREKFENCALCQLFKPVCTRDSSGQAICYNCNYEFKRRNL